MALACRAVCALVFAVALARASITVQWNVVHASPKPAPVERVQRGVVKSVRGTHVLVRLPDGTTREFIATPAQVQMLEHLVGTAIFFEVPATP